MTPKMKPCQIAPHPPGLSSPSQPFITSPITIFSLCQSGQSRQNISAPPNQSPSSVVNITNILLTAPPVIIAELYQLLGGGGGQGAKLDKSKPGAKW